MQKGRSVVASLESARCSEGSECGSKNSRASAAQRVLPSDGSVLSDDRRAARSPYSSGSSIGGWTPLQRTVSSRTFDDAADGIDDRDDHHWNRLNLDTFIGRQDELQKLRSVYARICRTPSVDTDAGRQRNVRRHDSDSAVQVVLVHGCSGTGKSALVRQFVRSLQENTVESPAAIRTDTGTSRRPSPAVRTDAVSDRNAGSARTDNTYDSSIDLQPVLGQPSSPSPSLPTVQSESKIGSNYKPCHYCHGKYDQYSNGGNLSAVVSALSQFFQHLSSGDEAESQRIGSEICKSMDQKRQRMACEVIAGLDSVLSSVQQQTLRSNNDDHSLSHSISVSIGSVGSVDGTSTVTRRHLHREELTMERLSTMESNDQGWVQIVYGIKTILKAICTNQRPMVMYLDDLQWADERSLQLVSDIMVDPSVRNFLLIGSYRSNEVNDSPSHPLSATVQQWKTKKSQVHDISLSNLPVSQITDFLTTAFRMTDASSNQKNKVVSLARSVYDKTQGNILYVIQAVEKLHRRKVIRRSMQTMQWEWDEDRAAQEIDLAANVLELITSKMRLLPHDTQVCLKIASCLRTTFRLSLLERLLEMEDLYHAEQRAMSDTQLLTMPESREASPKAMLDAAVNEGLLSKVSRKSSYAPTAGTSTTTAPNIGRVGKGSTVHGYFDNDGDISYRFTHDRVQQAAFSLDLGCRATDGQTGPQPSPGMMKHRIARHLIDIFSEDDGLAEDWMLFVAADHLEEVASIESPMDHIIPVLDLVRLNLTAGQMAVSIAAFPPAKKHMSIALDCLRAKVYDPWNTHRNLTTQVYRGMADVELSLGNYEVGFELCQQVLDRRSDSLEIRLAVGASLARAFSRDGRWKEALKMQLESLRMLKSFPSRNQLILALADSYFLTRYFNSHTDEEILSLPPILDPNMRYAAKCFSEMVDTAFFAQERDTMFLVVTRQVRLMTKYGVTAEGVYGLSNFASLLFVFLGNFELARRLIRLCEQFAARDEDFKQVECRYILNSTCFIKAWNNPMHLSLIDYGRAQKVGMEVGDLAVAYRCWGISLMHGHACGMPVDRLYRNGETCLSQLWHYKLTNLAETVTPVQTMCKYLLGVRDTTVGNSMEKILPNSSRCGADVRGDNTEPSKTEDGSSVQHWSESFDVPTVSDMKAIDHTRWNVHYWSMVQLANYFGDLDMGESYIRPYSYVAKLDFVYHQESIRIFHCGLILSRLAKMTGRRRCYRMAVRQMKEMGRVLETKGAANTHRYALMKADILAAAKKRAGGQLRTSAASTRREHVDAVRAAYDQAVSSAARSGHIQDTALGNELAAEFFISLVPDGNGDDDAEFWARHYLANSVSLYGEWGAEGKVRHMVKTYGAYLDLSEYSGICYDGACCRTTEKSGSSTVLDEPIRRRTTRHSNDTRLAVATAHQILVEVDPEAL